MLENVTVIIPTLCKSMDIMNYTLEQLNSNTNVKAILIFDNTLGQFKNNLVKVKIFNTEDLHVNPAWNRGLELCETEYFLLLNDDVVCYSEVITACVKMFNINANLELATVATSIIKDNSELESIFNTIVIDADPKFFIQGTKHGIIYFFGWFIFGRTSSWEPIDKELKIYYGDNLTYFRKDNEKQNIAFLENFRIFHRVSTTCKTALYHYDRVMGEERPYYIQAMQRIGR